MGTHYLCRRLVCEAQDRCEYSSAGLLVWRSITGLGRLSKRSWPVAAGSVSWVMPSQRHAKPHAMHDPHKGISARPPGIVSVVLSGRSNGLKRPCKDLHMSRSTKPFWQWSCDGFSFFLQKQAEGEPSCPTKRARRAGRSGILRPPEPRTTSRMSYSERQMRSTLLAGMSTAKPHGRPESGAPEKYPKPAKGGTRGPWPKGGNFLG